MPSTWRSTCSLRGSTTRRCWRRHSSTIVPRATGSALAPRRRGAARRDEPAPAGAPGVIGSGIPRLSVVPVPPSRRALRAACPRGRPLRTDGVVHRRRGGTCRCGPGDRPAARGRRELTAMPLEPIPVEASPQPATLPVGPGGDAGLDIRGAAGGLRGSTAAPPAPHRVAPARDPDRAARRARRRLRRIPGRQPGRCRQPLRVRGDRGPADPAQVPPPATRGAIARGGGGGG